MSCVLNAPDVLTVDECAVLLRVCTKQVRKMVKNQTFETYIDNQLKAA